MTVIERFIREKVEGYNEPTRQGVPRGEKRGFPRKKLYASLLALTDATLQDQAKRAGISYDVLRKWRSEPEFKQKVEEHRDAFLRYWSAQQQKAGGDDLYRKAQLSWNASSPSLRPSLDLLSRALDQSAENAKTWRELQTAAISQVIELLKDQSQTMKYREQMAELLSVIEKNLTRRGQKTGGKE
jgi:hypothetical protein